MERKGRVSEGTDRRSDLYVRVLDPSKEYSQSDRLFLDLITQGHHTVLSLSLIRRIMSKPKKSTLAPVSSIVILGSAFKALSKITASRSGPIPCIKASYPHFIYLPLHSKTNLQECDSIVIR